MTQAKHKPTGQDITEFIESIDSKQKRADAYELLKIFSEVSGFEPKMWYPNIIGFGEYHYIYESGHEGDASYIAFSPRKAKISLYLSSEFQDKEILLQQFGKHKAGKSCIYINKLADIDTVVLKKMLRFSIDSTKAIHHK